MFPCNSRLEAGVAARIARENNEAYIAQLAGDPELIAWLDENGLTAAEAAHSR